MLFTSIISAISNGQPATILVANDTYMEYYAFKGGNTIFETYGHLENGINPADIQPTAFFTADSAINTPEDLEKALLIQSQKTA